MDVDLNETLDLQLWNYIVAAVMPVLVALVQQPGWSRRLRALVTLVACLIGGFVTAYVNDRFNTEDIVTSVLTIFAATLAFHTAFFKPTGITDAIEGATSPGANPHDGAHSGHSPG